jgi:hypothetical protein
MTERLLAVCEQGTIALSNLLSLMAQLIFDGITLEQARALARWYEGQGEQEAATWMEISNPDLEVPMVRVQNPKWCRETEHAIIIDCSPRNQGLVKS